MGKAIKGTPGETFTTLLLQWNKQQNKRQMPWKGEKDPYRIWLSEIILQQTRVEQGLEYYNSFIKTFPSILQLAKAPDEKVFKLWEGLGYYSRCRNLLATARYIAGELKGKFPSDYESIRALKGVGPYTAAAIASFAYNLPYAVVDGNVYRVLARVFGIDTPTDSPAGKKAFTELAENLLDQQQPGQYNQAIMDFGATVCKPAAPLCKDCVFKKICVAFAKNKVDSLPVKEKKIAIKKRWFYYLVPDYKGTVALRQRMKKDIWQGLFEFPLIETDTETPLKKLLQQAEKKGLLTKGAFEVTALSPVFKQQLSHQLIAGQFISIKLKKKGALQKEFTWAAWKSLSRFAFPQFINQYLKPGARENVLF